MRSDRLLWILLAVLGTGVILLVINHDAGSTLGIDNDQFATLIWVGTLGTVIGLGIVTRARPGGDILRQIAIWLAVFLALVVGYRLYQGEPLLPGNQPPNPDPGGGVNVFLMDRGGGPRDFGGREDSDHGVRFKTS